MTDHFAEGKEILYLCQDETRVGLKTIEGKVITAKGVKPITPVQWKRDNFWMYGAIAPLTGESFHQEQPTLNSECFQSFLDWLSDQLGERWAFLHMDQAPAHMARVDSFARAIHTLVLLLAWTWRHCHGSECTD